MEQDVRESFLRLTEAGSAEEVMTACEADPRILHPAFESYMIDFEETLRAEGEDADQFTAWRLVLQSIREGRNLYASVEELLGASSARAVRDVVVAEPLLLDPAIDALLAPIVRAARQQGERDLANAMESRRRFLAVLRARGIDVGYFDTLVDQLFGADASREAELRQENDDLAGDFLRYAYEEGRLATHLGDHDRMQKLMLATAVMAGSTDSPAFVLAPTFGDRIGRLVDLFLGQVEPEGLRHALLASPELLADGVPFMVSGVLQAELDRAALDRDLVRVRELWMAQKLLVRCAEIGVAATFDELEGGELWPEPNESI